MRAIIATISIAILIIWLASVSQAQAREPVRETYPPHFDKGPYIAKVTVRLDTDCWNQVKVRLTPDKEPSVLVNKQYFYNHAPGVSHWTKIITSMKFGAEKLSNGRLRAYAVVDVNGDSDYQYKTFTNTQYQKQGWIDWTFHLHTNPAQCPTYHTAGS